MILRVLFGIVVGGLSGFLLGFALAVAVDDLIGRSLAVSEATARAIFTGSCALLLAAVCGFGVYRNFPPSR